jgi:HEAT repeat protein
MSRSPHARSQKGQRESSSRRGGENTACQKLLADLEDHDGATRERARLRLVQYEDEVVPALSDRLQHPVFHVRWEAAKALAEIATPAAAPALVQALRDDEQDVRWLAAEGLIAIGAPALRPLLVDLIEHGESPQLRQGAHHVLHEYKAPEHRVEAAAILTVLDDMGAGADVIPAAQKALQALS